MHCLDAPWVRRASRLRAVRVTAAAVVAAIPLRAFAADAPAVPCGPATSWADFSAIELTSVIDSGSGGAPSTLQLEQRVHEDGLRIVGIDGGKRTEVLYLGRVGGRPVLASTPTAVREFGEIGMAYDVPIRVLEGRFHALCALHEQLAYPIDFRSGPVRIVGSASRRGEVVGFELRETREHGQVSYVGSIDYHRPRGTLPPGLTIAGWTVFMGDSSAPEDGVPSTFRTLGEFEDSLPR